jgi:hypothetical protein
LSDYMSTLTQCTLSDLVISSVCKACVMLRLSHHHCIAMVLEAVSLNYLKKNSNHNSKNIVEIHTAKHCHICYNDTIATPLALVKYNKIPLVFIEPDSITHDKL